jgi:hypothetical protein
VDVKAVAEQRQRRRQPADASTDDADRGLTMSTGRHFLS